MTMILRPEPETAIGTSWGSRTGQCGSGGLGSTLDRSCPRIQSCRYFCRHFGEAMLDPADTVAIQELVARYCHILNTRKLVGAAHDLLAGLRRRQRTAALVCTTTACQLSLRQ